MSAAAGSPNRDRDYLVGDQYRTAGNITTRIGLHDRFSTNPYGWHRWVFDRILELGARDDARVLELGCGSAVLWRQNGDRIPRGWRVTLTDLSPGVLVDAKRNLASLDRTFAFERADAERLAHRGSSIDLVIANHMLYHVPDRAGAVDEIARVLAPGGRLIAAANGDAHLRELDALVEAVAPEAPPDDAAEHFGLENGAEQLVDRFESIQLHRYEDDLRVTDAAAAVDYVVSTAAAPFLTPDRVSTLTALVEEAIARDGALHITKDPGLFIATPR